MSGIGIALQLMNIVLLIATVYYLQVIANELKREGIKNRINSEKEARK